MNMKLRYRLFLRRKSVYYAFDDTTKTFTSLKTKDKAEASRSRRFLMDLTSRMVQSLGCLLADFDYFGHHSLSRPLNCFFGCARSRCSTGDPFDFKNLNLIPKSLSQRLSLELKSAPDLPTLQTKFRCILRNLANFFDIGTDDDSIARAGIGFITADIV